MLQSVNSKIKTQYEMKRWNIKYGTPENYTLMLIFLQLAFSVVLYITYFLFFSFSKNSLHLVH